MKKFKEDLLKLIDKYKLTYIENIIYNSSKNIRIKLIFNRFNILFDKELYDIFTNNKSFKNKEIYLSITYYKF